MKNKPAILRIKGHPKNLSVFKNKSPITKTFGNTRKKIINSSTTSNLYGNQLLPQLNNKKKLFIKPNCLKNNETTIDNSNSKENKKNFRSVTPLTDFKKKKSFFRRTQTTETKNNFSTLNSPSSNNIYEFNNINHRTISDNIPFKNKPLNKNSPEIKKQLQILSVMKKKINEQNKKILIKEKEIEFYKKNNNFYNNNTYHLRTILKSDISKEDIENNKKENISLKNELKLLKEENKKYKEENENYKKEIQILNEKILALNEKYEKKSNEDNELKQKYNFIKNSVLNENDLKQKYENRLSKQDKLILDLEEKLNQYKINENKLKKLNQKKSFTVLQISSFYHEIISTKKIIKQEKKIFNKILLEDFSIKGKDTNISLSKTKDILESNIINPIIKFSIEPLIINKNPRKNILLLSDEEYKDIDFLIKIILQVNYRCELELIKIIEQISLDKIDECAFLFCDLLKIYNKNKYVNKYFNDLLYKKSENNNNLSSYSNNYTNKRRSSPVSNPHKHFEANKRRSAEVENNNDKYINSVSEYLIQNIKPIENISIDDENFYKFIKERCELYDYKKNGCVPFNYFRHMYKEYLYKKKIFYNHEKFFQLICLCKSNPKPEKKSGIFEIFYVNLVLSENKNENANDSTMFGLIFNKKKPPTNNKLKYEELINDFLDGMIGGVIEKYNEMKKKDMVSQSFNLNKENKIDDATDKQKRISFSNNNNNKMSECSIEFNIDNNKESDKKNEIFGEVSKTSKEEFNEFEI